MVSSGLKLVAGPAARGLPPGPARAPAVRQLLAQHCEFAAGDGAEPGHRAGDGGLAGAALAHQPEHLARPDLEADPVQRPERPGAQPSGVVHHQLRGAHGGRAWSGLLRGRSRGHRHRSRRAERRYRCQQFTGVGVRRGGEQLAYGGLFHDPAGPHHRHPVGQVGDHAHVVGDQQHRGAEVAAAAVQQVQDLRLHGDVQRGGRLVGHDQPAAQHQRHRDHRALLLAARQLVREVVHPLLRFGDADPVEHVDRQRAALGAAAAPVRPQPFGDLPADGEHRVQRGGGLLEDHRGARPAQRPQLRGGGAEDVLRRLPAGAAQQYPATGGGGRGQQPEHRLRGHRLAAAALADQGQHLSRRDRQTHPGDGRGAALVGGEGDMQILDPQQVSHRIRLRSVRPRVRHRHRSRAGPPARSPRPGGGAASGRPGRSGSRRAG